MFATRTIITDAIYHSNTRSELRLDPMRIFTGNLRLGNLGCTITNPAEDFDYNQTSGVYSLIQNIYLYDGSTVLDQLYDAHHMFGFRNVQNDQMVKNQNARNFNLNQVLCGISNCFSSQPDKTDLNVRPVICDTLSQLAGNRATQDSLTTLKGWINLQDQFSFLRKMVYSISSKQGPMQMQFIDTNVFQNLRIVIEWRSGAQMLSCFQGDTTGLTCTILQPQLFVDEVMEDIQLPKSLSFQFFSYELDKFLCSGGAAGTILSKQRANAFNGKYLTKLLTMNIASTQLVSVGATDPIKCDGSLQMPGERLQLVVNGSTLFDFNGIDSDARKLGLLEDAWGDMNLPILSYLGSYGAVALPYLQTPATQNVNGRMSYGGCLIGNRISEFQVEHTRVVGGAVDPFLIYLWGECAKQVAIDNGKYAVAYV